MSKGKVKIKDKGWLKIKKKYLEAAKSNKVVKAGQPEEVVKKYPGREVTTADVAFFHEYGTVKHRERAWLRNAFTPKSVRNLFKRALPEIKRLYKGGADIDQILETLRTGAAYDAKWAVRDSPLIDTGLLRDTTGAVVGKKE
jgi:hypothetical protein